MARWIKTSGEVAEVRPENGTDFSLRELKGFVDGYIEIVFLGEQILVVNEEGKLLNLPLNVLASMIAGESIAGNALLCGRQEVK